MSESMLLICTMIIFIPLCGIFFALIQILEQIRKTWKVYLMAGPLPEDLDGKAKASSDVIEGTPEGTAMRFRVGAKA